MPDTSFSWRGLREHLRRYLWIYLLGVALCLVGTGLLWTTTAPRLDYDEVITVFLADTYSNGELLNDVAADMLADAQAVDPAVKQVSFDSLLYDENEYTSGMLLVTRLAVGEGVAGGVRPGALVRHLAGRGDRRERDLPGRASPGRRGRPGAARRVQQPGGAVVRGQQRRQCGGHHEGPGDHDGDSDGGRPCWNRS